MLPWVRATFWYFDFDYIFSMAFYDILLKVKFGSFAEKIILDFFGKAAIARYYPVEIPEDLIEAGRMKVVRALDFYRKCKEENHWPTKKEMYPANPFAYLEAPYYGQGIDSLVNDAIVLQENDFLSN